MFEDAIAFSYSQRNWANSLENVTDFEDIFKEQQQQTKFIYLKDTPMLAALDWQDYFTEFSAEIPVEIPEILVIPVEILVEIPVEILVEIPVTMLQTLLILSMMGQRLRQRKMMQLKISSRHKVKMLLKERNSLRILPMKMLRIL